MNSRQNDVVAQHILNRLVQVSEHYASTVEVEYDNKTAATFQASWGGTHVTHVDTIGNILVRITGRQPTLDSVLVSAQYVLQLDYCFQI